MKPKESHGGKERIEPECSLTKKAEQQARETEEAINKLAAMIAKTRKEAEKAKQVELDAKERVRQLAEEARKVMRSAEKARKQAEHEANEQKRKGDKGPEGWQGTVRILVSCHELPQMRDFEQQMRRLDNFKVLWSGGSVEEGLIIVISLQEPIALIQILSELSMVKSAVKEGKKVRVTL